MTIKDIWHSIKKNPLIGKTYNRLIGDKKVRYIYRDQNKEIRQNGNYYLKTINDILKKSKAIYYVYAGTLLGVVRDKKLIKWDLDIDFAVVIDEKFSWIDLQTIMEKNGFEKVREFVFEGIITEQTYQVGKMKIDFFGQFYMANSMIQYSYEKIDGIKYQHENELSVYLVTLPKVIKTRYIKVDDISVSVPYNAEQILEAIYNEDWKIPNPNWKSNSGKCSQLLKDKYGYQIIK